MPQLLESPVQVGDVRLAPTTELAGLAELGACRSPDDRLEVLHRIALALRDEDRLRDEIARLRAGEGLSPLPRRRVPARGAQR